MLIDFDGEISEELMGPSHDANLAEFLDEGDLQSLASELIGEFDTDKQSRKEWARSYVKGLDLLGMKIEERSQPWDGASGVFHPVLTVSVVRFQAQAMSECSQPVVQLGQRWLANKPMTRYNKQIELRTSLTIFLQKR